MGDVRLVEHERRKFCVDGTAAPRSSRRQRTSPIRCMSFDSKSATRRRRPPRRARSLRRNCRYRGGGKLSASAAALALGCGQLAPLAAPSALAWSKGRAPTPSENLARMLASAAPRTRASHVRDWLASSRRDFRVRPADGPPLRGVACIGTNAGWTFVGRPRVRATGTIFSALPVCATNRTGRTSDSLAGDFSSANARLVFRRLATDRAPALIKNRVGAARSNRLR